VKLVSWSTSGAVTRLTLDRPEALNALSEELALEFAAAVKAIAREPSKVVLVRGAGRAFSAGGDLSFIESNRGRPRAATIRRMRRFYDSFLSVRRLPQATIAQVAGPAIGAGLCLALACDLRVVLSQARLALNFVRLGLGPGLAAWPLARAAFGEARARELMLTGRSFTGEQMAAWGAAASCEPTAELVSERAEALAAEIAAQSGLALRLAKREMQLFEKVEPLLAFEAKGQAESFNAPDLAEGIAAVRERRAPRF